MFKSEIYKYPSITNDIEEIETDVIEIIWHNKESCVWSVVVLVKIMLEGGVR
jgi:hypothetical protein